MSQNSRYTSFEDFWIKLKDGMDQIYHLKRMDPSLSTELQIRVCNYCMNSQAQSTGCEATTVGAELYDQLKNYLRDYVESLFQSGISFQGEDFLQFYTKSWKEYRFSSSVMDGVCSYFNRHWVRRQVESGKKNVYKVFSLAIVIWKEIFVKLFSNQLIRTCLDLINAERNQKIINNRLIRATIKSYGILWLGNEDLELLNYRTSPKTPSTLWMIDVYEHYFEDKFLRETEEFYRLEATNLSNKPIIEYLDKMTQRIEEEMNRLHSYLYPSTLPTLMQIVEEVFLSAKTEHICNEIKSLLENENHQDMALLYKYTRRFPSVTNELRKMVEIHVDLQCTECITLVRAKAIDDPIVYIQTILHVRKKLSVLVQKSFNDDPKLIAVINRACVKFINESAVSETAGHVTKSAELLARFCDVLLKKGDQLVKEINVEDMLDQIAAISNYIEDKDFFEYLYSKMLAKRLVGQLSASDEYEESMIVKLQQTCSFEYTWKWQRMFNDVQMSKTLMEQYRTFCENRQLMNTVDFQVMVLSSNFWPFSTSPLFNIPIELKPSFDSFTQFYTYQHNNRKLTWLHQQSKGELETYFTRQKYTLQVSMYQMAILLLFNDSLEWTVEHIQDKTQINIKLLLPVLTSLIESKLLTCTQFNGENLTETDIKMNSTIQLTSDFKSKYIRVNLNVPLKLVEQKDIDNLHRTIDEDRILTIQAAIVRTMKARQTLRQVLLIQEVIAQLRSRFKPDIREIQRCIDILIEKEYLERKPNDKDILRYSA